MAWLASPFLRCALSGSLCQGLAESGAAVGRSLFHLNEIQGETYISSCSGFSMLAAGQNAWKGFGFKGSFGGANIAWEVNTFASFPVGLTVK